MKGNGRYALIVCRERLNRDSRKHYMSQVGVEFRYIVDSLIQVYTASSQSRLQAPLQIPGDKGLFSRPTSSFPLGKPLRNQFAPGDPPVQVIR
jgi:hypothetical protein